MAKKISLNDKANRKTGTDADEIILAKGGNDFVDGAGGNDSLDGGSGNDKLRGGAGDDIITGGSGKDTAIFSGALEDENGNLLYSAEFDESGRKLIVTDLDGEDGTDSLQDIEFLQFADRTVSLDDFVALMEAGDDGAVGVDIDNVVALKEGSSGGTTPYTFNIRLSHASAQPVVVHVASQEGTASSGEDFQSIDQDVEFLPGDVEQSVTVLVAADKVKEGDEEFRLVLSDAEGAEILGDGVGTGRILNDDAKTAGQVGISIADLQIKEGNGGTQSATLTVALSGSSSKTITVAYASVDGSASGGDDFQPKSGTLTFKPGDTQKTIVIPINGDTQPEGDETFTVALSNPKNAQLLRSTATVTIQEDDSAPQPTPNQNPVAKDDRFTGLPAGQQVIKTGADLTANDVDPDADPITVTGVSGASGGTVSLNAQGQIIFTPDTGATRGSYLYTVTDGKGGTGQASVSLEFAAPPQNHSPVAQNDSFTGLPANQAVTKTSANLTANDSDPDGDPLTVTAVANATGGTVALTNGQIVFTPATNATVGSYGYTVSDGKGGTASATVSLGFLPANRAPTAVNDSFTGKPANQAVTLTSANLTGNDSDPDGDPLTVTAVANATGGTVALTNSQIVFTPATNATAGSFGYTVSDGKGGTAQATVSLGFVLPDPGTPPTTPTSLPPDTRSYDLTLPLDDTANTLDGSPANEKFLGLGGDDKLNAKAGNDYIDGGEGNDSLWGDAGEDYLLGGNGADKVWGGTGNDSMDGGAGNNELYGEDGNDLIVAGDGNDKLDGGKGNDILNAGSGNNEISGQDGNDELTAGGGNDKLWGGKGNDKLNAGNGINELYGEDGDDQLEGGAGVDRIDGGDGRDIINGGAGDDALYGYSPFTGSNGYANAQRDGNSDLIHGGDGNDTIMDYDYDGRAIAPVNQLYGDAGNDTIKGPGELYGGTGNDYLQGGWLLDGGDGNDTLVGVANFAQVFIGGAGADKITTDGGKDEVRYLAATDSGVGVGNRDTITDFDTSSGDVIDLWRLSPSPLSYAGTAAFSGKAGEVRYDIDVPNNRTVVGIDLNGDKGADMEIELVGVKILAADDFFLTQPA